MDMNILSWAALIVLVIFALRGMRRGLILTVFSTFTMIVAIIVSTNVSPYISQTWQKTAFFNLISNQVEKSLFGEEDIESNLLDVSEQTEMIKNLPLPESVKKPLLDNHHHGDDALGINAFKEYIAKYVARLIVNAVSFMVVFLVLVIILNVLAAALNIISHLPVLHTMNKLGGFLAGLLNGLVILWIICIAATIFSTTELGGYVYRQINESLFLRLIYNNNYLMVLVAGLKYWFT